MINLNKKIFIFKFLKNPHLDMSKLALVTLKQNKISKYISIYGNQFISWSWEAKVASTEFT